MASVAPPNDFYILLGTAFRSIIPAFVSLVLESGTNDWGGKQRSVAALDIDSLRSSNQWASQLHPTGLTTEDDFGLQYAPCAVPSFPF
jgi:hypothetical protein